MSINIKKQLLFFPSFLYILVLEQMFLGRGAYGVVEKMKHKQTGTILAVKRITATDNSIETKRLMMDLDISLRSSDCPYTVHFYGAMFREGDVWICMEVMDTSVDKFYQKVFKSNRDLPEWVLGKIAFSVVSALHYLHTKLKVIHRQSGSREFSKRFEFNPVVGNNGGKL